MLAALTLGSHTPRGRHPRRNNNTEVHPIWIQPTLAEMATWIHQFQLATLHCPPRPRPSLSRSTGLKPFVAYRCLLLCPWLVHRIQCLHRPRPGAQQKQNATFADYHVHLVSPPSLPSPHRIQHGVVASACPRSALGNGKKRKKNKLCVELLSL